MACAYFCLKFVRELASAGRIAQHFSENRFSESVGHTADIPSFVTSGCIQVLRLNVEHTNKTKK